jgi:hypothetical protein
VFENAGVWIQANANSGTPFSRRQFAYELTRDAGSVPLDGQINGSRLPWQFRLDASANKIWDFKYGANKNKNGNFELFFTVTNVLNTLNILGAFPFTGSAFDDGYLTSPQGRNQVSFQTDAQAYADLYNIAMLNPGRFTLPRRMRIGVRVNL